MPQNREIVTINSRKYDGKIHRSWQAAIIEQKDSLIVFEGVFETEVTHTQLGVIRRGTVSYEYYWFDRCYNIFRFHEPEGGLRNFYCNVNLPPTFEKGVLDYIDLDIDVLVWKDFSVEILDLDEFEENALIFNYPEELKLKAQANLDNLLNIIKNRQFPFNLEL